MEVKELVDEIAAVEFGEPNIPQITKSAAVYNNCKIPVNTNGIA